MKHHFASLLITAAALAASLVPVQAQTPTPSATPVGYVDAFQVTPSAALNIRQAHSASRLSQNMLNGERQLLANFRSIYAQVWHNSDGLTPQQVCDGLGARAGNLFVIAGYMQLALYQIDPEGIGSMVTVPPGYTATINADGTVTITFTAPSPTPTPP